MGFRNIAVAALLCCAANGLSAESPGLSADQAKTLESVRASALQYTQKLPDFICTQITHRHSSANVLNLAAGIVGTNTSLNAAASAEGAGPSSDVIVEQLTFVGKHESYDVISVNGKNVSGRKHTQFEGAITIGEFGTELHDIFDPGSHTVFTWRRMAKLRDRPVYVFGFHVPAESGMLVSYQATGQRIVVSYSGQIFVDADTMDVLRISSTLDLPPGFPIRTAERLVEYMPQAVAGKEYSLPFLAEVHMRDATNLYVNRIDFMDYRKFVVETKIDYPGENPR